MTLQLDYRLRPARGYPGLLSEGTRIEDMRTYINFNGGTFSDLTLDFSASLDVAPGTLVDISVNPNLADQPTFRIRFPSRGTFAQDYVEILRQLNNSYITGSHTFTEQGTFVLRVQKRFMGADPVVTVNSPADYGYIATVNTAGEDPDCDPIPFATVVHQDMAPATPQPLNNYYFSGTKDYRLAKVPEAVHDTTEVFVGITARCYHHSVKSNEVDVKFPSFSNCSRKGAANAECGRYEVNEPMKILEEGALWVCPVVIPCDLTDRPCYRINAPSGEQLGEISSYPAGGLLPTDFADFPCDARWLEVHEDDGLAILHIDHVNVG